jgi:hypothetical protein
MVLPPQIRRQRPGSRVQQTTVTLPGDDMERLRKEAYALRMTVSMYARNMMQELWQIRDERAEIKGETEDAA